MTVLGKLFYECPDQGLTIGPIKKVSRTSMPDVRKKNAGSEEIAADSLHPR
jgi:hypothetical protein